MYRASTTDLGGAVTVRLGHWADELEVKRLAALDSARKPCGDLLVAERDARIVAALPLGSGRPIADPFEPTAEIVALLELRAAQLRARGAARRSLGDVLRRLLRGARLQLRT